MAKDGFVLPILYLRQIADLVRELGADVGEWLARGGLSERRLEEPSIDLSLETFRRLVVDARAVTGEPALGLLIGRRLSVATHGVVGFAAMASGSIRQAMELVERFVPLRTSVVAVRTEIHGDEFRVVFREAPGLGEARDSLVEAVMLAVKNIADHLASGDAGNTLVCFGFTEPAHADLARALFRCEVIYARPWTGFSFPLAIADRPVRTHDAVAFEEATRICRRELARLVENETESVRVRRLLLERENHFPTLQVTARLLRTTPRTLHRRLVEEGTSYKEILEEVRHGLAVEHLRAGRLTIKEIAFLLGYTDTANFRRAFKRWEGVPPSSLQRPGSTADPSTDSPRGRSGPRRDGAG